MPLVIPTPVPPLTEPPSTSDSLNFDLRGDLFLGALPEFGDSLNVLANGTYQNALYAYESASYALSYKNSALNYLTTIQGIEAQTLSYRNSALSAAAAAQASAGLPSILNRSGHVLTANESGVSFERFRGIKSLVSDSFTAQTGFSYAINTVTGAINLTLPAEPSAFTSIEISDVGQMVHQNKVTILRNGVTEVSKTNTLLQSTNMFVSPWSLAPDTGFLVTQSTSIPSPDGTTSNVTKYVAQAPVQSLLNRQADLVMASGEAHMISMYVFVPSGQVSNYKITFDYNGVDVGSASSTTFDQWVRVYVPLTTTATRTTLNIRVNVNGSDTPSIGFTMYTCRIQDELGTLTSFIPTTTAAVTRAAGVKVHPIMFKNEDFVFDIKGGRAILEFVNEFLGWQVTQLQNRPESNVFDNGTSAAFNYKNGQHQIWHPTVGTQTVTLTGWSESGLRSELLLEVYNLGAVSTLNLPTIHWFKGDGTFVTSFADTGIVFNASGVDFIYLFTMNAGSKVYGKVLR